MWDEWQGLWWVEGVLGVEGQKERGEEGEGLKGTVKRDFFLLYFFIIRLRGKGKGGERGRTRR